MAFVGGGAAAFDAVALAYRKALLGASDPMTLLKNLKVFGIACFACLDMGDYIQDQKELIWNSSKQVWLVSILELGAWLGIMYPSFLAEILSRKYAILVNFAIFIIDAVIQTTSILAGHNSISHRPLYHWYGRRILVHDCTYV
ncbi:hypothetical protein BDU57DRAFT_541450 [Ampelomyces quisqualis]|uniref:Major facilitator superfamily domain-containing protein n=1 Tax=Ampelomyces quisqualis TaxID=50730 RepID=A0A6A5QHB3_AMPQU|nr:hypothetical protein BDU57DRAFT_541450 [Ampelomyces quisqualis]